MILVPRRRIEECTAHGWWGTRRIHDWFDDNVRARPDAEALIDAPNRPEFIEGGPKRHTWRQLDGEVVRLATWLLALGVAKDDVVCVQLPNCVELPAIYLACMRLGIVVTPVPVQYREHELEHVLGMTRPKLIVTAARIAKHGHLQMMRSLAARHSAVQTVAAIEETAGAVADCERVSTYERRNPVDANEVFTICWTSGTESRPKGVPRSHNEWLVFPETIILSGGLKAGCHLLNAFPFVNMAGIAGQFLPWLLTGGKLAMHQPFALPLFLRQLRDEAIDYTVASPAVLAALAQNPDLMQGIAGGRLRAIGSASGALAEWVVRVFTERYGIDVVNYFGSNEGCSLTASPLDLPDPAMRASFFPRFGVEGFAWKLPVARRVRTRLVDPDTGEDIDEPGRAGELRAAGPAIFSGYLGEPEMSTRAFDERGFYRSGDLFEIAGDRKQFYRFVGRLKDIVVRGGFNISSEELEGLLCSHPKVLEAAVVGYPDATLGERVCAVVVPREGSAIELPELVEFLRSVHKVAAYKLPERLMLVEALPRNPVGKVLKRELRAALQAAASAAA